MRMLAIGLLMCAMGRPTIGQWVIQESGTKARLRGLAVIDPQVAWASGAGGTCLRTSDGGVHWNPSAVPDSAGLDFRDVEGFDDRTACLLSIGPGELSRIYRTSDAGHSWTLQHTNRDPKVFLDAIAFWDAEHGLALGDPVDGRFAILTTDDSGRTWSTIPENGMPKALPEEGAFAASGTCLVARGRSEAWFGTGGGASARVFRSSDRGRTWSVAGTPIRSGRPSAGIFSLAIFDGGRGVAVGGDYKAEGEPAGVAATTEDGGRTWAEVVGQGPSGYRSAVSVVPGLPGPTLVCVGPSGTDRSVDGGRTWSKWSDREFDALDFGNPGAVGWAVGESGRVGRTDLTSPKAP